MAPPNPKRPDQTKSLRKGFLAISSRVRESVIYAKADLILAVSGFVANSLTSIYGIPPEKIRIVYNGVDETLFHPRGEVAWLKEKIGLAGRRIILFVGHFGIRKSLGILIEAASSVVKEFPDVAFLLVGGTPKWLGSDSYWAILQEEILSRGLSKNVFLMDRVPHVELPYYYSMSEMVVLPSYGEGFGKVLLEAMACGKPVVATQNGGPREIVRDGVDGFLAPYGCPDDLAEAVTRLLSDQRLAIRMGSAGLRKVAEDFTWRQVAKRIDDVYRELI